ncbi:hypothetical protein CEV32_0783 [Brucella rhizosphaerae]|uniref:Uncharacterized protein n=1 Tax=Brucella rhizosphaerae TaxID=571254 RepID=A0A256FCY5_9HYPH|nr:hypothetical protein CEV32_0783 [Brucella rhizosphaerae]
MRFSPQCDAKKVIRGISRAIFQRNRYVQLERIPKSVKWFSETMRVKTNNWSADLIKSDRKAL